MREVTLWYRVLPDGRTQYNHLQIGPQSAPTPPTVDATQARAWASVRWQAQAALLDEHHTVHPLNASLSPE